MYAGKVGNYESVLLSWDSFYLRDSFFVELLPSMNMQSKHIDLTFLICSFQISITEIAVFKTGSSVKHREVLRLQYD